MANNNNILTPYGTDTEFGSGMSNMPGRPVSSNQLSVNAPSLSYQSVPTSSQYGMNSYRGAGNGGLNGSRVAANPTSDGIQWTGKDGVLGPNGPLIPGLNALAGGLGAYSALQQYRLNKEAFGFNKAFKTTELGNTAKVTNAAIEDRARTAGRSRGLRGEELAQFASNRTNSRSVKGTL